jgi:hypothetical protein
VAFCCRTWVNEGNQLENTHATTIGSLPGSLQIRPNYVRIPSFSRIY